MEKTDIELLDKSLNDEQRKLLNKILSDIRNKITLGIVECNNYCYDRNDIGQTHRRDDPYELISYHRGKSIGFIMGKDLINKLIKVLETKLIGV